MLARPMSTITAPNPKSAPELPLPPHPTLKQQPPGLLPQCLKLVGSAFEWLFGVVSLFLGLSILASVLVGQFLVLGYILEVSGRISRSGRLRDAFIGIRTFARMGGIALGCFLLWLPLYFLSIYAENAAIIDPGSPVARQWKFALSVLAVIFALHVGMACMRGGHFRYFLWPFNLVWLVRRILRGGSYQEARDNLWEFVARLRLPYYFWLGLRGFVGALLWLAIPALLLSQGHKAPIVGLLGAVLLGFVVLYLPFLQARFARDNRLRAYRELQPVREEYCRAPIAFALALSLQLFTALPLYLFRIEMIPKDLVFLEALIFLLFLFPARMLAGWAYSRPMRSAQPRHWIFRWFGRVVVWPAVIAYVVFVFFSQHTDWTGILSLFNQHAFQLPVPFVDWKN
jgi:hypothetical protein